MKASTKEIYFRKIQTAIAALHLVDPLIPSLPAYVISPSRALGILAKLESRAPALRNIPNAAGVKEINVDDDDDDDLIEDALIGQLLATRDDRLAAKMALGASNFKTWLSAFSWMQV